MWWPSPCLRLSSKIWLEGLYWSMPASRLAGAWRSASSWAPPSSFDGLSWEQFETLVVDLLSRIGYETVQADGGTAVSDSGSRFPDNACLAGRRAVCG